MRQFITTKYLGPTNSRGPRLKAFASGSFSGYRPTLTVGWDHGLSPDENHRAVAFALAKRLGWSGRWIAGGSVDGNVYVTDCDPEDGFTVSESEA